MPETVFFPWGAVFESGKKYRKLVAQSLLSIFIHFLTPYTIHNHTQHARPTIHQDGTSHHMTSPDITPHCTTLHHITPHHSIWHHQPKLAILLCENSGAVVEWLMDKFNLDVSLVARLGGHSAHRTYRDPHLCFDSDGEEDCRKVRQGENDHQSTGDGVES